MFRKMRIRLLMATKPSRLTVTSALSFTSVEDDGGAVELIEVSGLATHWLGKLALTLVNRESDREIAGMGSGTEDNQSAPTEQPG